MFMRRSERIEPFRLEDQWYGHCGALIAQTWSKHSHHRVGLSIHKYGRSPHGWVCAEPLPHRMGKDHDVVLPWRPVLRSEVIPEIEAISHHPVKPGGHLAGDDIFRPTLRGDSKCGLGRGMQILKDGGLLPPAKEISGRQDIVMTLRSKCY